MVAASLARNAWDPRDLRRLVATTNAGAQAGHTTILPDGTKFVCYHLPTVGVMVPNSIIYLNAGSIIDPDLLFKEVASVAEATGEDLFHLIERILIHPNAAVIDDAAKHTEATATRHVGSTMKGVGAALTRKIMRQPGSIAMEHEGLRSAFQIRSLDLDREMTLGGKAVSIEIPQGTGLSLNSGGFFPKCTSRECWLGQGLTDAAIHPRFLGQTAMVVRTFPIRVGNITDDRGVVVGMSGDFYPDSREIDWGRYLPGVEPERTTVTQRIRRIATWSGEQYLHGLKMNRPDVVFLTFTNYCTPRQLEDIVESMDSGEMHLGINPRHVYSWGPGINDCSANLGLAMERCRNV